MFVSLQRERRNRVEPRCVVIDAVACKARTVAWLQVKPVEMMSNSTLPLGFLHSNTELVTCGQLLYFPILGKGKLSKVFYLCSCNEVHLGHQFAADLHFVIWVNDELRDAISIDKALGIIVEIHLETVLGKSY